MSAKHALLGLLLQKPAYRYQLGDRLQRRLGPSWKLNPGQLYQTIYQLQQEGLIERVSNVSDNETQGQEVFAITEVGADEFERWFEKDAKGIKLRRRPVLVKIVLAGPERLDGALRQIDAYEQECTDLLKELSSEQDEIPMPGLRVRAEHELLRYALSGDVFYVEGELKYARYLREKVSRLKSQDVIWPSTRERPPTKRASDRRSARNELFERIAQRHRTPPRTKAQDSDRQTSDQKMASRTDRKEH